MQPNIKRRSFLQALLGIPALAAPKPRAAQARTYDGLIFSDSDGNSAATLAALKDGDTDSGGISYAA